LAEPAMREAYGRALADYGALNPLVVALDADTSSSTLSGYFAAKYADRFFNVGIAEPCMVDMAAGLAMGGMLPFVNGFAALIALRALEQVRTCICYNNASVKIAAGYAGVSDFKDGPTHHAITDIAIMRSLPGMTVVVPADAAEAAAFVPLVADWDGPVYLRLSRSATLPVSQPGEKLRIGKAVLRRPGTHLTLVACGSMVGRCLQAADSLAGRGINACVLDLHTVKPLDRDMILSAASETGAILTAEEHTVIGGLGSAVAELLEQQKPVPLACLGIRDTFACTGPDPESIMDAYGLGVVDIVDAAASIIKRK